MVVLQCVRLNLGIPVLETLQFVNRFVVMDLSSEAKCVMTIIQWMGMAVPLPVRSKVDGTVLLLVFLASVFVQMVFLLVFRHVMI